MANAAEEVLALERRFWEESANAEFFKEAMADNALFVAEPMGFLDKNQAIGMTGKAEGWTDIEMQDVRVSELTPDCVAIVYHGQGKMLRSGKPYQGSICSVYVKKDGHWQLGITSHQPWKPETPTAQQ